MRAAWRGAVGGIGDATRPDAGGSRYGRLLALLLTGVLALDYADRSALGALGPDLEHAFHLGNTRFGTLASAYSLVGGLATLPAGSAVDRLRRTRVLALSVLVWSLAMGLTGVAVGYLMLLGGRLLLGAIAAAARPAIASSVGDVYHSARRGRVLAVLGRRSVCCFLAVAGLCALRACLRVFGDVTRVGALVVGSAAGYAPSRRTLPFGGAGAVEQLLPLALVRVTFGLSPALLAVIAHRILGLRLPLLPALLGRRALRRA